MFKFYSNEFNIRMKVIFDLFDFDNDGIISKIDVIMLLEHVKYNHFNYLSVNNTE